MTDEIREKAIEAACVEFTRGDMPSWRRWEEDERNETREAMARAIDAYERAMWRPVEEAPHDETVLLGCEQQWPSRVWISEVGTASAGWKRGGVSTMHRHGMAQFFRPLPLPPEDEA